MPEERCLGEGNGGYCLRAVADIADPKGPGREVQLAADDLVDATIRALPVAPEKITDQFGPALEVAKVDNRTADVKIIYGFRAHFKSSFKKKGWNKESEEEKEEFQNCLIQAPGEQLKRRVLHRGSMSFSDLEALEGGGGASSCEVLDFPRRCQWEIDPSEIKLGRRIAVGGFAEVFVAEFQGTIVAVKRMFDHDAAAIQLFRREVSILAKLRHPNLILFMGYCCTPELSIVSEFMQKGSLYDLLRAHDGVPMGSGYIEVVLVSVARAMAYLSTRDPPILHLDLKSPNILIDSAWRVKITDFGLSRLRNRTMVSATAKGHGTPHWMSPETIRGEKIDEKSDVYSFGVILWELLTGKVPWGNLNAIQVIAAVGFKNRQLPRPTHPETVLVSLMERCLDADPCARPSFPQILHILDEYYGSQDCDRKMAMLSLAKGHERSESLEPSSPMVGTVVEIPVSDVTPPSSLTQPPSNNPSLDESLESETQRKRSLDRLEQFEEKLKSEQRATDAKTAAIQSPFAKLASLPIGSSESEDEAIEARSCDAAIETATHGLSEIATPSAFSPFAAFSAMPFLDSQALPDEPQDHDDDDEQPPERELRSDLPSISRKSLKSQVSSAYDDLPYNHSDANDSGGYVETPQTSEDRFDVRESEWRIKVAEFDVPQFSGDGVGEGTSRASTSTRLSAPGLGVALSAMPARSESSRSHDSFEFDTIDNDQSTKQDLTTSPRPLCIPPMRFHPSSKNP